MGTANDTEKETITQDTFVKAIMQYISKDPQDDRNTYKHNRLFFGNKKPAYATEKDANKLILRKIFIDDETDIKITQFIVNYFQAVKTKWPHSWTKVVKNNVLNKSTGYIVLMKFFRDAVVFLRQNEEEVISQETFSKLFEKINIEDKSFTTEKYLPGAKGLATLYNELMEKSGLIKHK